MDETIGGVLGALVALGLLVAVAYLLDRGRRSRGEEVSQSDRKTFYTSMGLLVGGVIVLGAGVLFESTLIAVIGIVMWVGAWGLRWVWRFRKLR